MNILISNSYTNKTYELQNVLSFTEYIECLLVTFTNGTQKRYNGNVTFVDGKPYSNQDKKFIHDLS